MFSIGQFVRLDSNIQSVFSKSISNPTTQNTADLYQSASRTWVHHSWEEWKPGVWFPTYGVFVQSIRDGKSSHVPMILSAIYSEKECDNVHQLFQIKPFRLDKTDDQDPMGIITPVHPEWDLTAQYGFAPEHPNTMFALLTNRINGENRVRSNTGNDVIGVVVEGRKETRSQRPHIGLGLDSATIAPIGGLFSAQGIDFRRCTILNFADERYKNQDKPRYISVYHPFQWAFGIRDDLRGNSEGRKYLGASNVDLVGAGFKMMYIEPRSGMTLSDVVGHPDFDENFRELLMTEVTKEPTDNPPWVGIGTPPVSDIEAKDFHQWIVDNQETKSRRKVLTKKLPYHGVPTHEMVFDETLTKTKRSESVDALIQQRDEARDGVKELAGEIENLSGLLRKTTALNRKLYEDHEKEMAELKDSYGDIVSGAKVAADNAVEVAVEVNQHVSALTSRGWDVDRLLEDFREMQESVDEAVELSELYEPENERLTHENRELRERLTSLIQRYGASEVTTEVAPRVEPTPMPDSVTSVANMMEIARTTFKGLSFAVDVVENAAKLDGNRASMAWARKGWSALASLNEYALEIQHNPGNTQGIIAYLSHSGRAVHGIAANRIATEGKDTGFAASVEYVRSRTFKTAPDWVGESTEECYQHIKVDPRPPAPRLYFYDDCRGPNQRILVGYYGPHLMARSAMRT